MTKKKYDRKPRFQRLCAGLLGKALAAVFAVATVTMAYGEDYYVDATYGDDAWDGKTATIPDQATIEAGGTIAGPRKTLHAMMSDVRVVAGDTVWAAEGDYNDGGTVNGEGTTINRVQVKGGVMLRASGSRDKTFISGANGTEGAYSSGATRCVFFLPPPEGVAYGIVKGFTVRNGRTAVSEEYGGGSTGDGLMSECDFQNNGDAKSRGGSMNTGYAVRCKFTSLDKGFHGYNGTRIISSLIVADRIYEKCKIINSTFLNDSLPRFSDTFNCLFIGAGTSSSSQSIGENNKMSKHYKTYSRSEFLLNHCTPNTECRVVTAAETPYDETTFRPLTGSVVVDAGSSSDSKATQYNYENLTNGWPTAWLAEAVKDYYGGERVVNGKIDIGCGEMQPVEGAVLAISDSLNDLVIAGDMTEKGEFQLEIGKDYTITVSRSLTSELLCKGVIVNGVFHSFPTTGNEQPYEISLKGEDGRYSYITAVYETNPKDWYVNSDIGKNSNRGYHKNCPLKTLDKVMELADSGDIVHAAAGIYKSFADGEEYASANSRVTVKAGVGLVADDWPLKETVIEGEPDTTESADKYGNGPNAVRCVTVMENGYVRGFKLTKGHTLLKATAGDTTKGGACGGGALLTTSAALIDCELTGNICDYRGRAVAGDSSCWLIRCYVHDNEDTDEKGYTDVYDRMSLVDTCIITDDVRAYYGRGNIVNSTIMGRARLSGGSTYIYNSYIDTMEHNNKNFECRNCAFGNESSDVNADNTTLDACIFSVKVADTSDENYCPPMEITALVDAGNKKYYNDIFQHENFPAQAVQFRNDRDLANGQRVYNGKIDIGCGEYDFRSDFARILGARAVISEMGPNVTTNAVPDIVVPEGESIAMSVAPLASDRNTQYKFVYTPDGGSQTVVSEKSTDAFTRTLDGPCTVQTLTGYLGFVFQVR